MVRLGFLFSVVAAFLTPQSAFAQGTEGDDVDESLVSGILNDLADRPIFTVQIWEGEPAKPGDNPWQTSLVFSWLTKSSHQCGGVLIEPGVLITAAHCYDSDDRPGEFSRMADDTFEVLAGTDHLDLGGERIEVQKVIIHPQFEDLPDGTSVFDLAVVHLKRPVSVATAQTIDIADEAFEERQILSENEARITGWGITEASTDVRFLKSAEVDLFTPERCRNRLSGIVSDIMICAGDFDGQSDSCGGDSGGPLTVLNGAARELIGIISWGPTNCGTAAGVYARVSPAPISNWIKECVRDQDCRQLGEVNP